MVRLFNLSNTLFILLLFCVMKREVRVIQTDNYYYEVEADDFKTAIELWRNLHDDACSKWEQVSDDWDTKFEASIEDKTK